MATIKRGSGNQPAVTMETVLPSATLQCDAVSSDSGQIKRQEETQKATSDRGQINSGGGINIDRAAILRAMTAASSKKERSTNYNRQQWRHSSISDAVEEGSECSVSIDALQQQRPQHMTNERVTINWRRQWVWYIIGGTAHSLVSGDSRLVALY